MTITKQPVLSVIIPTYNIEKYLRECLDSIVNQTYENLEIIIIDDNSSDSTPDIIREYAAKDDRIKPVFHKKNAGPGATRNEGLAMATGDYVTLMDHDDWQDLDKYEKMMEKAIEHGADIVFCNAQEFEQNTQKVHTLYKLPDGIEEGKGYDLSDWSMRQKVMPSFLPPWAKIVRRSLVEKYNVKFSGDGNKHDDVLFHYHAVLVANKVVYMNEVFYVHRIFPESITGKFQERSEQVIQDMLHTWADLERICLELKLPLKPVLAIFHREFAIYAYRAPNSIPYIKQAQEILRKYGLEETDLPEGYKTYYRRIMHYWWGRKLRDRIRRFVKLKVRAFKSKPLAN